MTWNTIDDLATDDVILAVERFIYHRYWVPIRPWGRIAAWRCHGRFMWLPHPPFGVVAWEQAVDLILRYNIQLSCSLARGWATTSGAPYWALTVPLGHGDRTRPYFFVPAEPRSLYDGILRMALWADTHPPHPQQSL